MIRTSENNPLLISEISLGAGGGQIGITFAPGKQQRHGVTGVHQRNLATDLDAIAVWNAAAVVTLVEPLELIRLGISALGAEVRRRHMAWRHWPIQDFGVPDEAFEAAWPERSLALRSLLACGGRVLIHCMGGLGRAGMVSARLLVETGMDADRAVSMVRAARPGAIETREQMAWVAAGRGQPLPAPSAGRDAARGRAVGALLGLAVGDAVGAAIEFSVKPEFAVLDDMVGGGPHRLRPGQWTDDTAMALALADSLVESPGLDAADLMRRFLAWRDTGAYSCTGSCFDIGIATSKALEQFRRTGDALAGSTAPSASGNGALMRLAPVAIRHWRDHAELQRVAALQTCTTHGSPATLVASSVFATLLADAIAGSTLPEVLAGPAAAGIEVGWQGLHRDAIQGSGYVVRSLQAAVWAVSRTTDFRSAVLLAANLGDDADTTAAIAGQLAGAVYGVAGIPSEWLDLLAWRERLEVVAVSLFDAGQHDLDVPGGRWATRDQTMHERLAAPTAVRSVFAAPGFSFAEAVPSALQGEHIAFGWTKLGSEAGRFLQMLYDDDWVHEFAWSAWRGTPVGERLMRDPAAMAAATADDLARVLTTCVRADRFSEGYLADAFEAGLIGRVLARAEALLGRN